MEAIMAKKKDKKEIIAKDDRCLIKIVTNHF